MSREINLKGSSNERIWKLIELPVAEHVECVGSLHGRIKYKPAVGNERILPLFLICVRPFSRMVAH